jgi:hypothetical protein
LKNYFYFLLSRSKHRKEENELMTKQTKQMYETRLRQERELEETITRHRNSQALQHLGHRYSYRRGDFATFRTQILPQKRGLCNI